MSIKSKLKGKGKLDFIKNDITGKAIRNREIVWKKAEEIAKANNIEMKKVKIGYNKIQIEEEKGYWNKRAENWLQK